MAAKPTLYLIDGSSQMYRAYHAPIRTAEGTLLKNAAGLPTNAVYIFVTMLRKLLKEHGPQYIAASFDLPGRTFRDDLATDYKANRRPMPDELAAQIPLVHRACEALGVPIITHERYEADDVIGTMTERAASEGFGVAIVTGDKDFFQLVRDGIRVFNPRDEGTWYDEPGVKEKFGVPPDQVVDVLALMGDTIDNVKGVPGIGEKGARDLISTYGTLDALLEHAAEVPQKKYREALQNHTAEALSSRELLRIHTNVPVELDINAFRYRGPSREACYELFSELEFRSLVMEYAPTAATTKNDYRLVTTSAELGGAASPSSAPPGASLLRACSRDGPAAVTSGHRRPRVLARASARRMPRGPRAIFPFAIQGHAPRPAADGRGGAPRRSSRSSNPAIEKAGHDLKFDSIVLARHGVDLEGLGLDTMLGSYLLDATRSGHPLETTALEYLGYKAVTEEDVCGRGVKAIGFADDAARSGADLRMRARGSCAAARRPALSDAR